VARLIKLGILTLAGICLFQAGRLWIDKSNLRENLIRMHVVANSDSAVDQEVKLQVKDAVISYLSQRLSDFSDQEQALNYLCSSVDEIMNVANQVLEASGTENRAVVTLQEEAFDAKEYDTFSLPAGVYQALRIDIGSANGKNWWCVVFPTLCQPCTTDGFSSIAISAGFNSDLTATLAGSDDYELRFFLLDCLGKIENFLYES